MRVSPSQVVVGLDLETDTARPLRHLFEQGPEFIRLAGIRTGSGPVRVTTDLAETMAVTRSARRIVGHNLIGFDMVALARHGGGLDLIQMAEDHRMIDTAILATLADPPPARMTGGEALRHSSLDSVATRVLGKGKLGASSPGTGLRDLAREFGGYGLIPTDDVRYRDYLRQDVVLTTDLAPVLWSQVPDKAYAWREHRLAALAATMTLSGFRVDTELLASRLAEGEAERARQIEWLKSGAGLPTTRPDGTPVRSPQATTEGKAAIVATLLSAGLPERALPRTPKGAYALGREALSALQEGYSSQCPEIVPVIEAVQALNGVRTVYATASDNLVGDRVHPSVSMRQASGRWSVQDPGLTVFGKRGGRAVERAVFLPEPGHVLISADLSQVDNRAVAAWCQDPAYMSLFEPGRDAHSEVAAAVFGDRGMREQAKAIGHGFNYGLGMAGVLRQHPGLDENLVRSFYERMHEQYPKLIEWQRHVRELGESGAPLDNGFGRKLRCQPDRAYTQAPALVGQATARDLLMEGLLRMTPDVQRMIRAVVHDEVVLSVPVDVVGDVEAHVLDALSFEWAPRPGDRTVQVTAGLAARGDNWAACYGY